MSKQASSAKPITPRVHSLIDYGFAVGNVVLPRLLRLPGPVAGVFAAFGVIQGSLNALTYQPFAARKVVSFKLHGAVEKSSAPILAIAPLLAGALQNPRSRWYWAALTAALITVYNLTDWNAKKTDR